MHPAVTTTAIIRNASVPAKNDFFITTSPPYGLFKQQCVGHNIFDTCALGLRSYIPSLRGENGGICCLD
jgi:hypothetical protein